MLLTPQKILNKLISKEIISANLVETAQAITDLEKLENFLIEKDVIDIENLTKLKGEILNIPYINLRGKEIKQEVFDFFPSEVIKDHKVVAIKKNKNELEVAMIDPQDFRSVQAIEFLIKKNRLKVKYFIISPGSFSYIIKKNSNIGEEVEEALGIAKTKYAAPLPDSLEKIQGESEVVKGAPISKIVSVIIRHAVEGGASDIHIEPGEKSSKVRYRVDGILHTSLSLPEHVHSAIISRIKIMAKLKIDESRIPQDGRIRLSIDNRQIDFRVSVFPLMGNEKVVLRVLDTISGILSLSELGFNERHIEIIESNIKSVNGMLLLTGPTGSGKTTTLYSIMDIINRDSINIITLEDPVEYFIEGVNQSQVKPEIGYTFASGLRSILRQDPNVIMVGEIRDGETAELAIHASLTGHFVLSTLHTNNAVGALPRFIDMGAEPFLLASTLKTVVAQRLVRKVCPYCAQEENISENAKKELLNEIKEIPEFYLKNIFNKNLKDITLDDIKLYKGKGCEKCGEDGYRSRSVIAEVLVITSEIKDIISEKYDEIKIAEALKKQEMINIRQDGILKVLQGVTSMEEVIRLTKE